MTNKIDKLSLALGEGVSRAHKMATEPAWKIYDRVYNPGSGLKKAAAKKKLLKINPISIELEEWLRKEGKWTPEAFTRFKVGEGICYSEPCLVIPLDKDIQKLYFWKRGKKNDRWMHHPGGSGVLVGDLSDDEIVLLEGEWDFFCLWARGLKNIISSTIGAGNFPPDKLDLLKDKEVIVAYDNDTPGRDGLKRINKKLIGTANSIKAISWKETEVQDGEDVRDFFVKYGHTNEDFESLLGKSKPLPEAGKKGLDNQIDQFIESGFKNTREKNQVLTDLVREIVLLNLDAIDIETYKTTFKEVFSYNLGDFDKVYKEEFKRLEAERQGEEKRKKVAQRKAIINGMLNEQVDLIKIHAAMEEVSSAAHDLLEIVIATAISLKFSTQWGDALLWLLVVGAPSSDKTATVQSLLDMPNIYYLDTLTDNAFVSGYIPKDDSPTQDLLAELDEKCLVVKDYSTLFSLKADTIRKVLGDMQSIYDGSFSKYTGTRGKIEYQAQFSHIGCITPVALARHHNYMSMIGPRFLFYRVLSLNEKQREEGYEISWENSDRKAKVENLKKLISAYGLQLYQNDLKIEPETEMQKKEINGLVELLRHGRAVIRTERKDTRSKEGELISYYEIAEVQIEEPWRALQQLRTLIRVLAIVHKKQAITDHELELARRVVLSSMPVDRAEVLSLFQNEDFLTLDGGLTRANCAGGVGKSYNQVKRILTELRAIGLLNESKLGEKRTDEVVYYVRPGFEPYIKRKTEVLDHILDLGALHKTTTTHI